MKNKENNTENLPSISIVVPVFNEEKNIYENISLLKSEVSKHFGEFEIFIINIKLRKYLFKIR